MWRSISAPPGETGHDRKNQLYFGDNLEVLREHIEDESVDLIYLDPPFNSDARYNVFFTSDEDRTVSAQGEAFRDTWTWDHEAKWAFEQVAGIGGQLATFVNALYGALGTSDLMAYLVMMSVRLHELRRVLKPNGTLFLHCDPTASHYLKVILDGIFGPTRFGNEIIWNRTGAKGLATRRLPSNHDVILRYCGGDQPKWIPEAATLPYDEDHIPEKTAKKYSQLDDEGRRYQLTSLLNPNKNRPNLTYEFLGVLRTWRWTKERMQAAYEEGLVIQTAPGRVPRLKLYLDEQEGLPLSDVWTVIFPLNSQARERLGYPTQKPLRLLERIIKLSTEPGDTVLDPFCGCGTTVHAAQELGRRWIGIDVAYHAIEVISDRMSCEFALEAGVNYDLGGRPNDLASAARLAERDKFQFQWWANYLVGVQQMKEVKRGRDRGIDGEIFFPGGPGKGFGRILTSVKGGKNVRVGEVRDFVGVLSREGCEGGLFICLGRPTRDMRAEAAEAGFYRNGNSQYPRLQIVSIAEWFEEGKRPEMPNMAHIARKAGTKPKSKRKKTDPRQTEMFFPIGGADPSEVHINPNTAYYEDRNRQSG